MNWDMLNIKAAALKDAREATAKAEAHARMKRSEQMAEDFLLQLGTLLGDALEAGKAAVNILMDIPEGIDYEIFTACTFSLCPEGFRLKVSRRGGYIEAHMWSLACPPASICDYYGHDFRDDSYF